MKLQAGSYMIRSCRADDAEGLYQILSDPETMKYIEPAFSYRETEHFIRIAGLCQPPLIYILADSEDVPVGQVIFHPHDSQTWELGWILSNSIRGKGVSELVTDELIRWSRDHGIPELMIQCAPEQEISAHVAVKKGFHEITEKDGLRRFIRNLQDR